MRARHGLSLLSTNSLPQCRPDILSQYLLLAAFTGTCNTKTAVNSSCLAPCHHRMKMHVRKRLFSRSGAQKCNSTKLFKQKYKYLIDAAWFTTLLTVSSTVSQHVKPSEQQFTQSRSHMSLNRLVNPYNKINNNTCDSNQYDYSF